VKKERKDTQQLEAFLETSMGKALLATVADGGVDAGASDSDSEVEAAPDVLDKFLATRGQVKIAS
jgi:hypothetical protein